MLVEMPLDYVILDESQAIKNPASKVTKAARPAESKKQALHEWYAFAKQYF